MRKIHLSSPHMSGLEQRYIQEAFDTNWIAPLGPNVDRFEQEFCATVGIYHQRRGVRRRSGNGAARPGEAQHRSASGLEAHASATDLRWL
jgi:hypothetical protein